MARSVIEDKVFALDELQRNVAHHYQWWIDMNRTLVCRTPPKDDTLHNDAHCLCKLGRWLNGHGKRFFEHHPRFEAIKEHHKVMHDLARKLAICAMREEKISEMAYDAFQEAQSRLHGEIQKTYRELHDEIVATDPLTGAKTRTSMQAQLQDRIDMNKTGLAKDWLIMMDLDHFKSINDTYGHAAGDQTLATVAATVRRLIRSHDLFFRYGGEEFLLCICDLNEGKILEISDRIRQSVEHTIVKANDEFSLSITASFGIVDLAACVNVEQAIDKADKALYEAKHAGRNRVCFFSDEQYLPPPQATG